MAKVLLQTKELVKELMLEKFVHIIDGEIPKTYPILCSSIPELMPCDYCWLWMLPNGITLCLKHISISRLSNIRYRFALLSERPKVIHIPNSLSLKDRVMKTITYKRPESTNIHTNEIVVEFVGPNFNREEEFGFWECVEETAPISTFSQKRAQNAEKMAEKINKKYLK